jgi:hypothetical protein
MSNLQNSAEDIRIFKECNRYTENVDLRRAFPEIGDIIGTKRTGATRDALPACHRIAARIFRLRHRISSYSAEDVRARQSGYVFALNNFKDICNFTIPPCNLALLKFPVLGPREELKEDYMAPYLRTYYLYAFLKFFVNS